MSVFTGIKEILREYTNKIRRDCYAICNTTASTVGKVAVLSNCSHFTLETGIKIKVKFSYENTADSPTLKVQYGTSQETAVVNINKLYGDSLCNAWKAGEVVEFVYNGTSWDIVSAERLSIIENQIYDFVVTTTTSTSTATGALTVNLNNSTRPVKLTGDKTNIRVTLTRSCYSSVARSSEAFDYYPKIRIYTSSSSYRDIPIVVSYNLNNILIPCHQLNKGITTSGSYYFWRGCPTLDLVYRSNVVVSNTSGTSIGTSDVFLVKGNPDVIRYFGTVNYIIKADGYVEQWGESSDSNGTETISLPVTMKNTPYNISVEVNDTATSTSLGSGQFWYNTIFNITANSFKLTKSYHANGSGAYGSTVPRCWKVIGF